VFVYFEVVNKVFPFGVIRVDIDEDTAAAISRVYDPAFTDAEVLYHYSTSAGFR
jgi:hypothetical protein